MIFDLWHKTKYSYENGASFCHNITTLKPKSLGFTLKRRWRVHPQALFQSKQLFPAHHKGQ